MDEMLDELPGRSGLVIGASGGNGPRVGGGTLTSGSAWSTIKVPIVERVLVDFGGPDGLSRSQASNINAALTLSDNEAAKSLFEDLEARHGGLFGASEAVEEMLGEAGDEQTTVSTVGRDTFTTYGQTEWSLEEQNRYMAALAGGCTSSRVSRDLVLAEMAKVSSDTWGIGSAGVPAYWKGGWGPGVNGQYLVRQMGAMDIGGGEVIVTLAAIADDGTFESAQSMANGIAGWLADQNSGDLFRRQPC
jgi:hypothetical protein